ncbi:Alanine--tRNA ligase [Seminavis robusta]|uniref:Alanine--tRNA ligase n=1 Tax=Seminavis robusta TaxID=568900 RepID=A0A9N8HNM6_9STRA|nr:Alanine--tRNA ligase [Seminavis robusta]|eukprot:Sro1010_g230790.1 Alanine--tRNA ligase (280) ;mRNA; f:3658-4497
MAEEKNDDAALPPTEMIYYSYEGNFELECNSSKIVGITKDGDDDTVEVFLDRTVMHAQGGGQPTDKGTITYCQPTNNSEVVIAVDKVTVNRATGVASHRGKTTNALVCLPAVGTPVRVAVDADTRRLLSECHTAGHVVDSAMAKCGKLMRPTKGYHFLDGPYVEYEGSIVADERPQVLKDLQAAFKALVEEDIPTKIETLPEAEANEVCNRIAKNFDMKDFGGGKEVPTDIRVVTVAGFPCPCGGTHVRSTGNLKARKWGILGMKAKKGVIRIKYGQDA